MHNILPGAARAAAGSFDEEAIARRRAYAQERAEKWFRENGIRPRPRTLASLVLLLLQAEEEALRTVVEATYSLRNQYATAGIQVRRGSEGKV